MHHPTDRIAHTTAFVTPVVEHWLEREIAQWVHPMKDRSDDPPHHERTLLPRSYVPLLILRNQPNGATDLTPRFAASSRVDGRDELQVGHLGPQKLLVAVSPVLKRNVSLREREMFYLTTHSTHFIYGYMTPWTTETACLGQSGTQTQRQPAREREKCFT